MDDLRHQPQDAAGALKLFERAPAGVQLVEKLRVDRIGLFQLAAVVLVCASLREIIRIVAVKLRELLQRVVAMMELVTRDFLEETTADDLVALFLRRRTPRRFYPAKGLFEARERFLPTFTANFNLRGRQRRDEKCPRACLHGLGQRLDEGQIGVEGPGRQTLDLVDLAEISHPLVDQDQAWGKRSEQLLQ
ncbi:hypothetical protein D3C80_195400 [compost metagenome]